MKHANKQNMHLLLFSHSLITVIKIAWFKIRLFHFIRPSNKAMCIFGIPGMNWTVIKLKVTLKIISSGDKLQPKQVYLNIFIFFNESVRDE